MSESDQELRAWSQSNAHVNSPPLPDLSSPRALIPEPDVVRSTYNPPTVRERDRAIAKSGSAWAHAGSDRDQLCLGLTKGCELGAIHGTYQPLARFSDGRKLSFMSLTLYVLLKALPLSVN